MRSISHWGMFELWWDGEGSWADFLWYMSKPPQCK
jgi:hypothetical protein